MFEQQEIALYCLLFLSELLPFIKKIDGNGFLHHIATIIVNAMRRVQEKKAAKSFSDPS